MKKENDQWGNKEWREHWNLNKKANKKENLDDKTKWVNQGYAHETDKIRKQITEKIDILMDFQVW